MKKLKKEYDPHRELFELSGEDRYNAIRELPKKDLHFICGFYDGCEICPLALYHKDGSGYCTDGASEVNVRMALRYGAEFIGKEDLKNAKDL